MLSTIEKLNKKNKFSRPNTYKNYIIEHTYEENQSGIISVPLTINEIDLLAAYCQFKADEKEHAFHFSVDAFVRVLVEVFNGKSSTDSDNIKLLNLYDNWECWCPIANKVTEIELFAKNVSLNELIDNIVETKFE
ncbi:hypothetical protein P4571_08445 [Niallia alba]|uniref:hypothetical protein n=1 Tax=Niallia alba TaxID=2729105 RepID=UPI002E1E5B46|nr:hypothetical protein [Niallia alba]